jgi:hypothetical protein
MKLRTKLICAGILIILLSMAVSTGVMWALIRQQNDNDAIQRAGQLIDVIRREIDLQAEELISEMLYFPQDAELLSNITFLIQSEESGMGVARELAEFYQTEAGMSLANFARINTYNVLMLFDKSQRLVSPM